MQNNFQTFNIQHSTSNGTNWCSGFIGRCAGEQDEAWLHSQLSILRSFGWGHPCRFEQGLQAQQKDRPLGAAMVHELHRLLPTLVFEQDDGPFAFLFEVEADFCADPFLGPFDHLPEHALAGLKLENLHVETTAVKAELEHSADLAFPLRIVRPPGGKAFTRGQCLIDFIQRRLFDSDFVQYIYHIFP